LKTISFWNGETPVLALHHYATHPMSYYGAGGVSWDFVGIARNRRRHDNTAIQQIYVTGCAGDVTAGKYNDGSHANRLRLAERLYQAMVKAWDGTKRFPLRQVTFRNTQLTLEFHPAAHLTEAALQRDLADSKKTVEARILAALGLSSRRRVAAGRPIDMPCIDFGRAQIVLLPGESFIKYQLMAQQLRPDSFVMAIAYGECWPGYIPTDAEFEDAFTDKWLWVAPGSETRMRAALRRVLTPRP